MATIDFTPLFRSTVGFDRLPLLLSDALDRDEGGYPPYNIEKLGDDAYRIVMALAGLTKDNLEIVTERNRLVIRAEAKDDDDKVYLHRGLARRAFERVFDLADYVEVTGATMSQGLLEINLRRELPEALKPRSIPIGGSRSEWSGGSASRTIDHRAADNHAA